MPTPEEVFHLTVRKTAHVNVYSAGWSRDTNVAIRRQDRAPIAVLDFPRIERKFVVEEVVTEATEYSDGPAEFTVQLRGREATKKGKPTERRDFASDRWPLYQPLDQANVNRLVAGLPSSMSVKAAGEEFFFDLLAVVNEVSHDYEAEVQA